MFSGLGESAQLVHAEVAQRGPLRQRVAHAARGGRGEQRLSAVPGRGHALGAREGERGDIVAVARFRRSRVQAHAHAHGADFAPAFSMQRALRVQRRVERVAGVLERRAETIADDVEHAAVMRADRAFQQRVMARQRVLHRVGVLLEEPRRALDVGEEEGDGAAGQRVHASSVVMG